MKEKNYDLILLQSQNFHENDHDEGINGPVQCSMFTFGKSTWNRDEFRSLLGSEGGGVGGGGG